ncbi:MAG: hypothetical protein EOM20_15435 [Spartobacteria bacterium]|nr:hypothetical protein [Spartobacteria bacterium]
MASSVAPGDAPLEDVVEWASGLWRAIPAPGTRLDLSVGTDDVLCLEYDFGDTKYAYVVASGDVALFELHEDSVFSFDVKRSESANHLEFKVVDGASNTFRYSWYSYGPTGVWETMQVDVDDLAYAWGSVPKEKPKSDSHEGYKMKHSYWDDFWGLRGWRDGARIARIVGREDLVPWCNAQYEALKASTYDSIKRVMALHQLDRMPGCAELGDVDPPAFAGAAGLAAFSGGGIPSLSPEGLYRGYAAHLDRRRIYFSCSLSLCL